MGFVQEKKATALYTNQFNRKVFQNSLKKLNS